MAHKKNYMPLPDGEFIVWSITKSEPCAETRNQLIVRNFPAAALKTALKTTRKNPNRRPQTTNASLSISLK
ncbi:MAG: hypothetical protein LBG58_03295 [Planctomycetaceae bacterium]|nr:hypothetical protein [Planctomycetaceae bacterium]